jgi:26S proteasome regulatory subunit N4
MQARLKELDAQRTRLEAEIAALRSTLPVGGLVDADGFPRSDVDVYSVRVAQHRLSELETDHVSLMREIELGLLELHAQYK